MLLRAAVNFLIRTAHFNDCFQRGNVDSAHQTAPYNDVSFSSGRHAQNRSRVSDDALDNGVDGSAG